MLLQNANAIVFGAGGSLGGAVSKALAKAGAKVFVTGHTLDRVTRLAEEITAAGGKAEAAQVDALDANAVHGYVNDVARKAGTLDVAFNAIGWKDKQGVPLIDMTLEDFARPIRIAMDTQFITSTAAGRRAATRLGPSYRRSKTTRC